MEYYFPETIEKYDLFLNHMSKTAHNYNITMDTAMEVYYLCSGDYFLMKMHLNPFSRQNYVQQVWSQSRRSKEI